MKGLRCAIATLVTVTSFTLPVLQASARPVEPDFPCYMRTAAGRVVDLTASMCGGGQSQASTAMSVQAASRGSVPTTGYGATTGANASGYDSRYRSTRTETRNGVTRTISGGAGDDLSDARDRETTTSGIYGNTGGTRRSGNGSSGRGSSSGNCDTPDQLAADGSRCGGRAASERPGGR